MGNFIIGFVIGGFVGIFIVALLKAGGDKWVWKKLKTDILII